MNLVLDISLMMMPVSTHVIITSDDRFRRLTVSRPFLHNECMLKS